MRIQQGVQINAAPEAVWEIMANTERRLEWEAGLEGLQITSEGALSVDATLREVRKSMGRRAESAYRITEFEENKSVGWTTLSGPFKSDGAIWIEPEGAATQVNMTMEADVGLLFTLLSPIFSPMFNRQVRNNLRRFKALVEAEAVQSA